MFGFFLLDALPQNYGAVMTTDSAKFNALFHGLLDRGVYIAPALYEAGFVSAAHSDEDIAATIEAARQIFKTLLGTMKLRIARWRPSLLLPGLALAQADIGQVWINAGFYSLHFDRDKGLEDFNPGLGIEWPLDKTFSLTAGAFRNSDRERSHYLGLYVMPFEFHGVKFGAVVGGFDGYPTTNNGGWFPALIPDRAIEGKNWGLNIAIVPDDQEPPLRRDQLPAEVPLRRRMGKRKRRHEPPFLAMRRRAQWRKCRTPENTMATPRSSAASITS